MLLDRGKLEGAVARPQSGFGDYLVFETLWQQAAALLHGLVKAHAFFDGNKRCAWISTVVFLDMNDQQLAGISQSDMADYVEAVATDAHDIDAIAMWLYEHSLSF